MKKLICALLVVLVLFPMAAYAAPSEGVAVESFVGRFAESSIRLGFATNEYKNRILFAAYNSDAGAFFVGSTFQKSDILEYAFGVSDDNLPIAYFLAAIYEGDDTQMRIDEATQLLATLDITKALSKKWEKNKALLVNEYFPEMYYNSQGNLDWIWMHKSSKIGDKEKMLSLIPGAEYPVVGAMNDYNKIMGNQSDEERGGSSDASNKATLSVGSYDCPAHIPAGEYKVTPQKRGNLFVYRDGSLIVNEVLHPDNGDEIGRLVLKEGDSIEIAGGAKLDFVPLN